MSHLIAAPDKFRGTATAAEVAAAVGGAARRAGWSADEIPMSDGGEGLLLAVGSVHRRMPSGDSFGPIPPAARPR
jgi:glycerate kinase